LLSSICLYNF